MKFLADIQTSLVFVRMLRLLGWDVATAQQHTQDGKPDEAVLRTATNLDRVLITFDYLRPPTRRLIAEELRDHGGRVIRIGGGPDQKPERALGRLMFHHPEWYPWLEANEGKVEIHDVAQKCKFRTRDEVHVEIRTIDAAQFDDYLEAKAEARKRPLKRGRRRRSISPDQRAMDDLCG